MLVGEGTSSPLKRGPIGCPETSVKDYDWSWATSQKRADVILLSDSIVFMLSYLELR
jgi:hypothetical protein